MVALLALMALLCRGKGCRTITFEQFQEALEELARKRFKDKSAEEAVREVHRLVEGRAPIISGVTVRTRWAVDFGWGGHSGVSPAHTSSPPFLCRKPSPHPPYPDSPIPPNLLAPTRSASIHRARARARLAAWTWWTSQAMCLATSTQAPMIRKCRGASRTAAPCPTPRVPLLAASCHLRYIPVLVWAELRRFPEVKAGVPWGAAPETPPHTLGWCPDSPVSLACLVQCIQVVPGPCHPVRCLQRMAVIVSWQVWGKGYTRMKATLTLQELTH